MAKPRDRAAYEAFFGAPVRFGSSMDAMVFPSIWLDHDVSPAFVDKSRRKLPPAAWDFTDHVRHQIATRIGNKPVSARHVASVMGMSRRVFDRRLASFGVTFRRLLDEVRFARARRLLDAGAAPLSDISFALGYSEPSAFSRAFRMWAGMTPQAWRESFGRTTTSGNTDRSSAVQL